MAIHLLVDHGTFHNFGDAAMLESIVRRLHRLTAGHAVLYVRDCPLEFPIWALPNVVRFRFEIREPARLMVDYGDPPVLQRLFRPAAPSWTRQCFRWLGRTSSGWVPVQEGPYSRPLSMWTRGFDGLVVAGGGGLNDLFPEQIWQRGCLVNAFSSAGKPTVLTGQQLGPFTSDVTRGALKRTLARASFVGVREPGPSLELCQEAGLPPDRFAVMGDDALGLEPAPEAEVRQVLRNLGLTPGRYLAVNVRSGYYAPAYDHHLRAIAEAARRVACARDLRLLFVPIATGPLDSDVESARRLSEAAGGESIPVFDPGGHSAALVKGILGQAWAAMGVSYHFCHFALEQGVPAVLLHADEYYRQKGEGLTGMWGDPRLTMPIEELGREEASEALLSTFDDTMLRARLQQRSAELRGRWEEAFDRAISTHLLAIPQSLALPPTEPVMRRDPLVSVIIPSFNSSGFIRETLRSVLGQTYRNLEVLVVDDGSNDDSPEIVEAVSHEDVRVILLRQPNLGVGAARNAGIARAQGAFIAPIDADDVWYPDKIEKQVRRFEEGGESLGLVYTWWVIIDGNGEPLIRSHPWRYEGDVARTHVALNFIGNASVPLIRRSSLERVGGYERAFHDTGRQGCEDWDLSLRVAEHDEMAVVPEYLVGYRRVAGSMSANYDRMIQSHAFMIDRLLQRRPDVTPRYLRYSRGLMYGYVIMVGLRTGDYRASLHLLLRGLFSPAVCLVSPWALEILFAKLPEPWFRRLTRLLWRNLPV